MTARALSLEQISDRIEIDDLLIRYTVAIDTKDWELLDTVFTPDAKVDYTTSGGIKGSYPEVRAWLAEVLALFKMTQHLISNSVVRIDGDTAAARTMVFNPMGRDDGKGGLPSLHLPPVGFRPTSDPILYRTPSPVNTLSRRRASSARLARVPHRSGSRVDSLSGGRSFS